MTTKSVQPNRKLETQLIVECSQTCLSPQQTKRVASILSESLDWHYTLQVASRNGVLPLVAWNLRDKFADSLPPEIENRIARFLKKHTQTNLFLTQKLIEIVNILEKVQIPVLAFKGTTLAVQAYGDFALRQYVDHDVLVQPKHFDEAAQILSENGYQPASRDGWLKRNTLFFFTRKKDVGLVSPDNRVRIELHWKLSGSHFALPFEINHLWERLQKLNLGGTELNILHFYDLFVYLSLHGSRHGWEKFAWICDLHELIRVTEKSGEKIDWTEVCRHAKNHGCEKVVELGLFLVERFFNVVTDYPDYERIRRDPTFIKIAAQIERRNFAENVNSSEIGDWYLYHLTLKERKFDRLKLHLFYFIWYLKLAFKPNALDKAVFHLPQLFYPLYFILRPFRLLFTYFNYDSSNKEDFDE